MDIQACPHIMGQQPITHPTWADPHGHQESQCYPFPPLSGSGQSGISGGYMPPAFESGTLQGALQAGEDPSVAVGLCHKGEKAYSGHKLVQPRQGALCRVTTAKSRSAASPEGPLRPAVLYSFGAITVCQLSRKYFTYSFKERAQESPLRNPFLRPISHSSAKAVHAWHSVNKIVHVDTGESDRHVWLADRQC